MPAQSPSDPLIDQAFAHHREGRLAEAEALYRAALETDSDNFQALQLLGTLALRSGRLGEALVLLERALDHLKRRGDEAQRHASLYNNLGIALRASGRGAEAAAHFRQGLVLDPQLTELHVLLGGALMEQGDFAGAAASFETALRINPEMPGCLCDLGTAYAQAARLEDAILMYRRVLSIEPSHRAARINLAQMLRRTEKYDEAIKLLTQMLQKSPEDVVIHNQLGIVYAAAQRLEDALGHFCRVLAKKPDDAEALQYVANIQQAMGYPAEADRNYRRSLELRPLITIAATKTPPDFRVLLLFAPGAGNMPLDCLVDQAGYENNILNLLPDAAYDIESLRARADVVVNLIADVDQSRAVLEQAVGLIDRIGRPIVNHPRDILKTDRAAIAASLAGLSGCHVPQTRRYAGRALSAPGFDVAPFSFPLLARLAGMHGGVEFEKVESRAELAAFAARHPEMDYYLSEYVDYRSGDGYFRKYRFIFIGAEILAYHLAIDDKWKIHHVTTDMANQLWMQAEEKAFLENPRGVFEPRHYDALRAIRQKIGLDYFGIDCGLGRDERVVVFEVNACMLVHQHNEGFPYKVEPVRRIKAAFDAMLARVAAGKREEGAC